MKLYNIQPDLLVSKKIALVGNSDCILNKDYSNEIDSFTDVIRFNFGAICDKYTGRKTTIRWINCPITLSSIKEHIPTIKNDEDFKKYVNTEFNDIKIIGWKSTQDKLKQLNSNIDCYLPNEFCGFGYINSYLDTFFSIKTKFDIKQNCWPRTGFHAIMTCIKTGCVPYLYGFDYTKKSIIKHYSLNGIYYTNKMVFHQINKEIDIINELAKNGILIIKK